MLERLALYYNNDNNLSSFYFIFSAVLKLLIRIYNYSDIYPFKLLNVFTLHIPDFPFAWFFLLRFYSSISHRFISLIMMRRPWEPGIDPITPVWWDIKPERFVPARSTHSINTTIKNPSRFDYVGYVSNRRWQDRSSTRYIYICRIASEQRVPRISLGPNPLYWSRVDNRPMHRRIIEGCIGEGKRETEGTLSPFGQTKATRWEGTGRYGELTNRSAINMLILPGQSRRARELA